MDPRKTWAVARREFNKYFVSPTVYVVFFAYLFLIGYYTVNSILSAQQAGLNISMYLFLLIFIVPILTMGLISSERREGTVELIFTSPIRASEFVLGKFLGVFGTYGVILLISLFYPAFLLYVGDPSLSTYGAQYLGLILVGGAFLAIGLFCSTVTESNIIAAVVSFMILLLLMALSVLKSMVPASVHPVVEALEVGATIQNFQEGLVQLTDVVVLLSVIVGFLYLSMQYLNSRSWEQ